MRINKLFGFLTWVISALILLGAVAVMFLGGEPFNIDSLGKLASIAVAPLTLALVWLTKVLADETRSTRLQKVEPHVIVTLEPSRYIRFFDVIIENVGDGPAFDIEITFEPEITFKGRESVSNLSENSILRIPTLKSKQKVSSFIAEFDDIKTRQSKACCISRDTNGNIHRNYNGIDIDIYKEMMKLRDDNIEKIANGVEKIGSALEKTVNGFSRLSVNTFTAKDREEERRERDEWIAEVTASQNE